jgi:glycerol-3-phosphate acyltransferase PlsX
VVVAAGPIIALDAMGGDNAPGMVLKGAAQIAVRFPDVRFLIFGDETKLRPLMASLSALSSRAEIRHTAEMVNGEDKPSQVLRRGRNTSMRMAIDAVANGEAQAVVSAGNTGALMALSKFVLRTMPGIDRPAITSFFPAESGECVLLDLGANVECDANNLVQFAVMGANFAHAVLGRQRPTVGLLNVGTEELKGNDEVRGAAEILRNVRDLAFEFHGFVEGDDIARGTVDVIVTDGFTGNVALKTAEGTAKMVSRFLGATFRNSLTTRFAYLLARISLNAMRDRVDPRYYNGGVFLGLNGIVVKSHGGSDAVAFAAALLLAVDMVRDRLIDRIAADFKRFATSVTAPPARMEA